MPSADVLQASFALPTGEEITLDVPASGDVIGDQLLAGSYEVAPAHELLLELLGPGDLLLDVGAHLGTITVPAARRGAKVVAVEPNPTNASLLRSSAAGLDVTVVEAAAGAEVGSVTFLPDGAWGRIVADGEPGAIRVAVTDGRALAELLGRPPDVVKLDVEGYELEALAGIERLLAHRPPLVFESNAYALWLRGQSADALNRAIEALGYRVFRIDPDRRLVPAGTAVFQARSWVDCLAVAGSPSQLASWTVTAPTTTEDIVGDIVAQSGDRLTGTRAWLASALLGAGAEIREHPVVQSVLVRLADDPEPEVRRAARTSVERRGRLRHALDRVRGRLRMAT